MPETPERSKPLSRACFCRSKLAASLASESVSEIPIAADTPLRGCQP